jgi:hypothetical protein
LAAWAAAAVGRQVKIDQAAAALESVADGHVVVGLAGRCDAASTELSLAAALTELVDARPPVVRVAFPAPGDPLGLGAAGPFTSSAVLAGSAVVVGGVGLVPEPDPRGSSYRGVRWQAFRLTAAATSAVASPALDVAPSRIIEQADRALRRALRDATQALEDVDLARWRPQAATGGLAAAAALRTTLRALPPSWPLAARALAERSIGLWRALDVVGADDGAASASADAMRRSAVRDLSRAVREAAMVAFNVPASALLAHST